jgi:hypothetical protein
MRQNLGSAAFIHLGEESEQSTAHHLLKQSFPASDMEASQTQKERTGMDAYSVITEQIIEKQAGTVPWHKPWPSIGAPRNLVYYRYRRQDAPVIARSRRFLD